MKKWEVTFTEDMEVYMTVSIDGTSYTDAYVNTMVKYPGAIITDMKEASNA